MDKFKERALFVLVICTAMVGTLALIWEGRLILLLLFAGCVGALILSILTEWFQSAIRVRRSISFAIVLTAIATLLGFGVWVRGPALAQQFGDLQTDIPVAAHQVLAQLEAQSWGHWVISHSTDSAQISKGLSFAVSGIGGAVLTTVSTIAGLFLVVMTSIYLAAEPDFYLRGFRRLLPRSYRAKVEECLSNATRMLRSWLLAKIISMTAIGTFVTLGLLLLGVPLAGTLGVIAGLLTFIPNLGPILSLLPAVLLAFAVSPAKGFLTILLFCLAHFLEGNLVTPLAERKIVRLPPALTLAVQLLLAPITGALGVALAAPLTAAVLGIVQVLRPPDPPKPL